MKTHDYPAWQILRLSSITDLIIIKAKRIRSILEKGEREVGAKIEDKFYGIINYCIIALIQMKLTDYDAMKVDYAVLEPLCDHSASSTLTFPTCKNHDHEEAWSEIRVSCMTDLIMMKLLLVKQSDYHKGKNPDFRKGQLSGYDQLFSVLSD